MNLRLVRLILYLSLFLSFSQALSSLIFASRGRFCRSLKLSAKERDSARDRGRSAEKGEDGVASTKKKSGFWFNYKSDGKREGAIILAAALLLNLKSTFNPVSIRTTCSCPTGPDAEKIIESFKLSDSSYHCLPGNELLWQTLVSPIVLPGDPEFDTQLIRVQQYSYSRLGSKK